MQVRPDSALDALLLHSSPGKLQPHVVSCARQHIRVFPAESRVHLSELLVGGLLGRHEEFIRLAGTAALLSVLELVNLLGRGDRAPP
eukprot:9502259-Pyramimonas_sp.AAC.1